MTDLASDWSDQPQHGRKGHEEDPSRRLCLEAPAWLSWTPSFPHSPPRAQVKSIHISTTTMLARVARSAAQHRVISSTASAAKSLQLQPASASTPPPVAAAVSSGELAWCEIYGVDYEQQVQEALDESPLLVSDVHKALPTLAARAPRAAATTATSSAANAKGDIWNVVFGATA